MLKKFIDAKKQEILELKRQEAGQGLPKPYPGHRPELVKALSRPGPSVIAEYKRASPSRGVINTALSAGDAAKMFVRGGARAFSVLTEHKFFQGDLDFLGAFAGHGLPVLRKDFLFHPLQVRQTASTPASALLFIVRIIQDRHLLKELVKISQGLGLEPVVEIFNHQELEQARFSGARIILVNNRDLDSMKIDLNTGKELIGEKDSLETWICASGLDSKYQVYEFYHLGFEAFLIGTGIMSSDDPEDKLREFSS